MGRRKKGRDNLSLAGVGWDVFFVLFVSPTRRRFRRQGRGNPARKRRSLSQIAVDSRHIPVGFFRGLIFLDVFTTAGCEAESKGRGNWGPALLSASHKSRKSKEKKGGSFFLLLLLAPPKGRMSRKERAPLLTYIAEIGGRFLWEGLGPFL